MLPSVNQSLPPAGFILVISNRLHVIADLTPFSSSLMSDGDSVGMLDNFILQKISNWSDTFLLAKTDINKV